jgi:hypothetical protein
MNRQIVMEINEETYTALVQLQNTEPLAEDGSRLTMSTVTNRAVQVYAQLQDLRREGKRLYCGVVAEGPVELTAIDWE